MGSIETRPAATTTAAREALAAQVASESRHLGYSLDAIHRAVGSPAGRSPDDWLDLARPVLDGMRAYRRRLHDATNSYPLVERDTNWRARPATVEAAAALVGAGHPFEVKDLIADEEIATLYATFLDHGGLLRNTTEAGKRELRLFRSKVALYRGDGPVRCLDPVPKPQPVPVNA